MPVTVLISPQVPSVLEDLRRFCVRTIPMEAHPALPAPVCCHADLVCFPLEDGTILLDPYSERLDRAAAALGLAVRRPALSLGGVYPADTALCAARVGGYLLCRKASTDPELLRLAGCRVLEVRQGYARCATLAVDGCSLITADPSVAGAGEAAGLRVLRIAPGDIRLDGYDTGFIGGCAVRIAPDAIYLTGRLAHPDADAIRRFAAGRGVALLEGSAPELIDIGGGVPLPYGRAAANATAGNNCFT